MVDTNILLSAILFPQSELSSRLVAVVERHQLVLPTQILEESQEVINRKFSDSQADYRRFIAQLNFEEFKIAPDFNQGILPEIRDPKDAPILAAAIVSGVDFFITGDKDFHVLSLKRPAIITLTDFSKKYL